jgi:hypothetical protein
MMDHRDTHISPLRIALFLAAITGLFLVAHLAAHGVEEVFGEQLPERATSLWYLEEENNIPTWYSSTMLAVIGGVVLFIGLLKFQERDPHYRQWIALAFIPLLVSLDDAAQLHEATDEPLADLNDWSGLLFYAWVLVVIPIVALVTIPFIPFLLRLPKRTLVILLAGAGVVFTAGVLLEMPEGLVVDKYGEGGIADFVVLTAQEVLEMAGAIIVLYAMMDYLAGYRPQVTLSIERDKLPIGESMLPVTDEGGLSLSPAERS